MFTNIKILISNESMVYFSLGKDVKNVQVEEEEAVLVEFGGR